MNNLDNYWCRLELDYGVENHMMQISYNYLY
jgi:hypothetical protein